MSKSNKFVPRYISADMKEQGYNNEGRGTFLGCIGDETYHEETCAYRKNPTRTPIPGEPNAYTGVTCNCRIGLWQEVTPSTKVVNEIRKTRTYKNKQVKPIQSAIDNKLGEDRETVVKQIDKQLRNNNAIVYVDNSLHTHLQAVRAIITKRSSSDAVNAMEALEYIDKVLEENR